MANNDKLRSQILSRISSATRDLSLFDSPTPDQRRVKERFWAPFMQGDTQVPENVDLATALRFGSDKRLSQWWDIPGFQDWFLNNEEFKERIEFIAHLALDGIEEVLRDRTATASSRVAAAKLALEVANKLPKSSSSEQRYLDEKINEMDSKQLEKYIQSKLLQFPLTSSEESNTIPDEK